MVKKPIFLRPFQVKVTIALILAMIFPLLLSNLLVYKFTSDSSLESLRSRLKLIAQIASELVDPVILSEIPLNRQGVASSQFQTIAAKLRRVKAASPQVTYIYILKKTTEPGIWEFVVDPDPSLQKADKLLTSFPGDKYNARRFPEMLQGYTAPSADRNLQVDEWGVTLSGYAPIYDARGQTIAVLGVDVMANDVYALRQEVKRRSVFVVTIGLCLCLLLGMILSTRITDPVEKLVEGTRRLASGKLNYQVPVTGNDELSELAQSFNDMATNIKQSRRKVLSYFYNIIRTLVRVMEVKDHYTRGHSEIVARYAGKIASRMGFSKETVKVFRRMTLLHDIGKLGIKDEVLNKVEPLTLQEWEDIKKHPAIGENILRPILGNDKMLDVIRQHHERLDGKGYPANLEAKQISIFASIVAVADAYSAMTSDRSYRKALSCDAAVAEFQRHRGTQFHPEVVDIFLQILAEEKNETPV